MPRFSSNGTLEKQKNLLFNSEEDYYQVTDVQFGEPTDIIGLNLQCNSHEQSVDERQRRRKKNVSHFFAFKEEEKVERHFLVVL